MAAAGAGGNSGAIRAGRAFVEIFADDKALMAGLNGAKRKLMSWGAGLSKIGAGATLFGGGILGALGLAGKNALDTGSKFQDLADSTGATVEELQALALAAELSGEGLESIEGAIARLQKNIGEGGIVGGLDLGSLANLSLGGQLDAVAKMLNGIENKTLRNHAAMQIFGKSGSKIAKVLANGLSEAGREMEKLSGLTADEVQNLDDIGDDVSRIGIALSSFVRTIGGGLFGGPEGIRGITETLKEIAPGIRDIISANSGLVQGLAIGAAAITAFGAALAGLGMAAMGVSAIAGFFSLVIANPITAAIIFAVAGAVVALTAAVALAVKLLRDFTDVGSSFGTVWQGILNSIKGGSLAGAFRIAFIGAKLEFLKFMDEVGSHWAFQLLAPAVAGVIGLNRAALQQEIAAIKTELDKAAAQAAAKAKAVGGTSFAAAFGLGGPTKGGFGTASQLGQQFGVGDSAKMLTAMQNTDKNTAGILKNTKGGGLAFT